MIVPIASIYAFSISPTAVERIAGVGGASLAPIKSPFTCAEVQNVPLESATRLKPVIAVLAIGLTPTFPATDASDGKFEVEITLIYVLIIEDGTVETPALARIAKFPALFMMTGAGPRAAALPPKACDDTKSSER